MSDEQPVQRPSQPAKLQLAWLAVFSVAWLTLATLALFISAKYANGIYDGRIMAIVFLVCLSRTASLWAYISSEKDKVSVSKLSRLGRCTGGAVGIAVFDLAFTISISLLLALIGSLPFMSSVALELTFAVIMFLVVIVGPVRLDQRLFTHLYTSS